MEYSKIEEIVGLDWQVVRQLAHQRQEAIEAGGQVDGATYRCVECREFPSSSLAQHRIELWGVAQGG